ncbi:MAG TPA: biopolymer transporter Tol [Melioribacteraceae bacterium]|nr:biopolymer transporter Tol [Melioribacteraceae bacterium]
MKFKTFIALLLLTGLYTNNLFAQFGQNKVQYKLFDWHFIQTTHFDIYFDYKSPEIAEFTAYIAERSLDDLQNRLKYKINNRIPIIIYNSHNDFQETNTTDEYLSNGVGGFTEPFKNRVVLPFEGSYDKFRHVIHHELVHAFMMDMLYGGTVQNIIARGITLQLPLWYMEGMAEYMSSNWETNSDMFVSDGIINESLPDIPMLNGYYAYRGGQSLMYYIANRYGDEKIAEILEKTKGLGNIEEGIKAAIGLTIEELNDNWKKFLKKEYWPQIDKRTDPDEFAKRLTNNKKDGGFYNTSPAISPQGDKIAFITDRDIFLNIYIMSAYDGKIIKRIVESGRTNDYEELNVLFPSLTWSPDNLNIALSVKYKGYDIIQIINTEKETYQILPFKLDKIESVSWSPDSSKLVFIGSDNKQSDLYLYDFYKSELTNLTNDIFTETDITWSNDSKSIIFSSDRGEYLNKSLIPANFAIYNHNFRQYDLYKFNLSDSKIIRITNWELSNEKSPIVSEDGNELIFVSDRNGIDNLYKINIKSINDSTNSYVGNVVYPLTNSLSGINQLSATLDKKKLVFTGLYKTGYNIFLLNNPFELEKISNELEYTKFMQKRIAENNKSNKTDFLDTVFISKPKLVTYADTGFVAKTDIIENQEETEIFIGSIIKEKDTTSIAENDDYKNYIFGGDTFITDSTKIDSSKVNMFTQKLDENGNYLVNKYKVNFSPDLIYANAGYSSLYGLLGTTVLSFSDMLGNHRLIGVTSLNVDLKNSDYGLAYYYLANRTNYGIEGFHTARFVYLSRPFGSELYRFRNYGAVFSISHPLSRFYRIDAGLSVLNVSSENLDDYTIPKEQALFIIPSVSFVHDNTLWGYYSPIQGNRTSLTLFGNPGTDDKRKAFYSAVWDYREYFRFWYDNGFVFRFSGGYSGGANPQRFFIGGTENWINRHFSTEEIPITDASDFAFLTPALPLRGYDYAEKIGTKYSLLNLELRVPIIRFLVTGPLPLLFQNILGSAFIDMGSAWDNTKKLKFFERNGSGKTVTKDLLIGTGYGIRFNFIFLWRIDSAWSFDGNHFSRPKYYLSLGLDF